MATNRFLIAPYDKNSGLRSDYRPWLIPDEAFSSLQNAYVFRGRVRKRFGSRWIGDTKLTTRLRVQVGTVGAPLSPVPGNKFFIGQMFSADVQEFSVYQNGAPAAMLTTGPGAGTFDTTNGNFTIIGTGLPAGTPIYWYPSQPVMGLVTFENNSINNEPTIAFDTQFSYQFIAGAWVRITAEVTPGAATWTGSDSQFFWGTSWNGANPFDYVLYVTNFNEAEPNYMRFLFNGQWDNFRPQITALNFIDSARIIVPFKNRLVLFNTWENEAGVQRHYPARARWSQANASPLAVDSWREDIPGKGSGLDAPTNEAIVTVEFIKDRLIVFFERSTWEFVYTGNQIYPFAWQQINTELGAESTFSVIPFDKVALGVGNVGVHACNGSNVERIDSSIPTEVFAINNSEEGTERVYGIRDYFVEMVYWTYPFTDANDLFPYPTKVLVYNYKTSTWAINDDSITAFGYFQPQTGVTWDSTTVTWDDAVSWNSGEAQSLFRQTIAGNQEGYTFIIDSEVPVNAFVLSISNMAVVANNLIQVFTTNHNLRPGDFVMFKDIQGTGNLNLINNRIFEVLVDVFDPHSFFFVYTDAANTVIAGVYAGGGIIARVSQISIDTKQFNFYYDQGRNAYVSKVDFQVDRTTVGELQIDFFVSTADNSMLADSGPTGSGALVGTGNLETFPYPSVPFEATASRLVHPVYFQADGEFIQLNLSLSTEQMMNVMTVDGVTTGPALEDFQMHSMTIYATPSSYRNQ